MDEATSALDKTNEKMVQEAIERYRENNGGISIITIAHRLSTIRDADKIVTLVNGVLTEMGSHDELMKNYPNGTYAGFVNQQAGSEAKADENQAENSDEEHAMANELESGKAAKLGVANLKSALSLKRTLSMRKMADPRETEMFEKCDLADAVERL